MPQPYPRAVRALTRCATAALALLAVSACAPAARAGASAADAAPAGAEILWDRYGVPHIFANDDVSLFRAFGWAQARAHADLLLLLYGQARGRAAEYWGEANLESDRWNRTMRVDEWSGETYARQTPEMRALLDAFAEGVTAYARAHPDAVADSVEAVLPVRGVDVAASWVMTALLFSNAQGAARRFAEARGSNAWAVAPSRSTSGNALLLANPHLPWSGGFTFFEAQMTAPGVNAYGATLVGVPVLAIAFNDHLGWTHTVNTQDIEDLYRLTLAEGGYRWDGGVRPFLTDTQRIRVRVAGGGFRDEVLVRRRSVHGPVIAARGDTALAVRLVSRGMPDALQQWWEMMRARDLPEFERAMARHQVAGFNVVYADGAGNVMYSYGAGSPRRPGGDAAFWSGAVRGDTSALLWEGVHGYAEMPRVVNPPAGWVQNANEPPWFSTFPAVLSPDSFPAAFAPAGALAFRPQQSIQLLREGTPMSLEEMIRLKHSTEMELAVRIVPELVQAARASGSADARAAADVLERWDRTTDADSRGGVLFQAWFQEVSRRAPGPRLFATPWSPANPLETPDGLADPAVAVAALETVAAAVRQRWGALDVPWGQVHRLRRDGVDLPGNGGPGGMGVFRVVGYVDGPDGRRAPVQGDTYVAAIEFSTPVRARALIAYGNASQPGSPHRTDQLELFARKELRPVWRTRAEIMANLRDREPIPGMR
jgi:acyl-homoserine-lactone acylase